MQKLKTLCLHFLLLLFITINYAQNKQIRVYNLEDGLPQSQVYDIIQDDLGYLWLGTQGGGIARFDGSEFKVFNEKKGLLSNYIHSLTIANNRLYIGTKHGLSIKNKNKFINLKSPQVNKVSQINNQIYLATNKGLYLLKSDSQLEKLNLNRLINNNIVNDIKYKDGWFFIASNTGFFKVNENLKQIIKLSNLNCRSITFYKEKVFCATFTNGILVFKNNYISKTIGTDIKRINSISIINQNRIWITTDATGISILNADHYSVIQKIDEQHGLPISHIRKCFKDKQSNIWIASSGGGIFKLFENNFTHFDKGNGLNGNRVYAIHSIKDEVYLSNSEEGLMKIDSSGNLMTINQGKEFLDLKVKTLASDSNDNLFVGTEGKGVLVIHNSKKDSIISYLKSDNSIAQDTININYKFTDTLAIKSDWIRKIAIKNNKIWVASYSSGISKFNYNAQDKTIENLIRFEKGIQDLYINDIAISENGSLWYGTKRGDIGLINNNRVTHFDNILNENTSIRTLLFHKEKLYIATSGKGIWWSNLSIPIKFTRLDGKKKLYSDNIYQLIFDAENKLWAGSENGVDKITLDKNNVITDVHHFGRNDGFLGIETCQNAIAKDNKENLWFGTINGLTKYQTSVTKLKQKKPNVFFEEIEVMNKVVDSISLQKFSESQKILNLNPKQSLLAFYFKTVDINNPKELQYRWKIDDYKWSNWNKDTKVNIASDYGNHVFYAQSRNLNWLESDIISFKYNRKKPLLEEAWFRTLLISLFGLLIIILSLLYFRKLKLKNKKERAHLQLQNDLLTLEQKALRLQMNPHFIFNVLNGIKAMSLNDTKTMHTTINKFATLLRSTLTNSRKDNITLSEEINTLKNYIEVEQLMSEKPFTYKLTVETELDIEEILIPPMLIQPFVENAIRHGIMAVKRKGKLAIYFKTKDEFLLCSITDNGIGINQSKLLKTKSNHQSMALQVTKERIEHLAKNNTLKINELTDKNNKLAGTKVEFKIPLITDY